LQGISGEKRKRRGKGRKEEGKIKFKMAGN